MYYKNGFYIKDKVGNNAFSYDIRKNKFLYVPSLIKINSLDEVLLGDKIAFSDIDFDGNLFDYFGLKNFYHYIWKNKNIYIFDNHNHAFYFWFLSEKLGFIKNNGNFLFHIDEHSDMRSPEVFLDDYTNLEKVFYYTNYILNVGNYIIPAYKSGLISDIYQIRSGENIKNYDNNKNLNENIILNLDLDFFEPNLDYIDYELKKKTILDIATKSKIITIRTSPYFINQKLALKVLKDIFS